MWATYGAGFHPAGRRSPVNLAIAFVVAIGCHIAGVLQGKPAAAPGASEAAIKWGPAIPFGSWDRYRNLAFYAPAGWVVGQDAASYAPETVVPGGAAVWVDMPATIARSCAPYENRVAERAGEIDG